MSLEQLEQQIALATETMEKASKRGDREMKQELANFRKVLETSKARLKELESIKKKCDELSACREVEERIQKHSGSLKALQSTTISKPLELDDDDSYFKPITIPWLTKDKKAEVPKREEAEEQPQEEDRNEEEVERNQEEDGENKRGFIEIVASFGSQLIGGATDIATVSSLGSQVFGTSEITKAIDKEDNTREARRQRAMKERADIMDMLKKQPEVREDPKEELRTPSASRSEVISVHDVAEQELWAEQELHAREDYINAAKEHQSLKKKGLPEDSLEWKKSEKRLRDCYAQVEYWESLNESASKATGTPRSVSPSKVFGGRDPKKMSAIDFDQEEQKAREAYISAMMHHQYLANQGTNTHSEEWIASQSRLHECLANLQYWESRRGYALPPTM